MGPPRFSDEEIVRRGEEIYEKSIRAHVEDQYDDKIIVIDIETGDYEIDDDPLEAGHRVLAKHPGAAIYALRIGHDVFDEFGGGPGVTLSGAVERVGRKRKNCRASAALHESARRFCLSSRPPHLELR